MTSQKENTNIDTLQSFPTVGNELDSSRRTKSVTKLFSPKPSAVVLATTDALPTTSNTPTARILERARKASHMRTSSSKQ